MLQTLLTAEHHSFLQKKEWGPQWASISDTHTDKHCFYLVFYCAVVKSSCPLWLPECSTHWIAKHCPINIKVMDTVKCVLFSALMVKCSSKRRQELLVHTDATTKSWLQKLTLVCTVFCYYHKQLNAKCPIQFGGTAGRQLIFEYRSTSTSSVLVPGRTVHWINI